MKKIKYWFRDYFAFTQSETRGVLVLLVLMVVLLCTPALYKQFLQKEYTSQELALDQVLLDSLMLQLEQKYQIQKINEIIEESSMIVALHPFDPNLADAATLTSLGFRPWIAERIINYRDAGGKFNKKEDLRKIYGLSEEMYQKVYNYIDLPEKETVGAAPRTPPVTSISNPEKSFKEKVEKAVTINLNTADTTQLKRLQGVGSTFAARIIKYRDLLGGFVDTSQYAEVYGLPSEVILSLQHPTVTLDTVGVRKINLNTADEKLLAAHPYISFKIAKAIVEHRKNYGAYTKIEDVKEVYLIDEDLFAKIARYLVI